MNRSKVINLIDFNMFERDAGALRRAHLLIPLEFASSIRRITIELSKGLLHNTAVNGREHNELS